MINLRLMALFVMALFVARSAALSPPPQVEVAVLAKSATSWEQSALPAYPRGKPEITVLRITIPGHSELPFHKHPVINAGVLTKGTLTVETDTGKKLHLKAGDALIEVVNQWHRGLNDADEPAEIIVFYAGVVGETITIKQ
jgi:quercetin dioxygenase-like cupin family protein